jgi:hypothetical protein
VLIRDEYHEDYREHTATSEYFSKIWHTQVRPAKWALSGTLWELSPEELLAHLESVSIADWSDQGHPCHACTRDNVTAVGQLYKKLTRQKDGISPADVKNVV